MFFQNFAEFTMLNVNIKNVRRLANQSSINKFNSAEGNL